MYILCMQYGGYDEVGCMTRDIYNCCHAKKQESITSDDAQTVINHMVARRERDSDFFLQVLG
jgi:zinc finger SWIM domain-containing protein 3